MKVISVAKVSVGLGQTPAVAAPPGGSVRGGAARVTGITLWGTPSKPWVSITASGPIRYQLRNVEPDWVVVDVFRAQLALASGKPPAGRGLVRQIRAGQFTQDVVRVVLELTESVPVHVATSPDKTAIIVSLAAEAQGNGHVLPASGQQPAAGQPANIALSASSTQHAPNAPPAPGAQPTVTAQLIAGSRPAAGPPSASAIQSVGPPPVPASRNSRGER